MNSRERAEQFTEGLGQIGAGLWKQIAYAHSAGIPKELGLSTEEWVREKLGGYVKLSMADRREAVMELSKEGHSTREVGEILGVSNATVSRDVENVTEPEINAREIGHNSGNAVTSVTDRPTDEVNDEDAEALAAAAVRGFFYRAREAREHAKLDHLREVEVTEPMIDAADDAAAAWSMTAQQLRRMSK